METQIEDEDENGYEDEDEDENGYEDEDEDDDDDEGEVGGEVNVINPEDESEVKKKKKKIFEQVDPLRIFEEET